MENKKTMGVLIAILMVSIIMFILPGSSGKNLHERAGFMEGAPNFRDLGGYLSANGKQTVWRKIFRSQTLAHLNDSDVAKIKDMGIRTVIDFRGNDEVQQEPSRLPAGINVIRLPIETGNLNDAADIMQLLMSGALDSAQCVDFMQTANRKFVTTFIPQYKAFFEILLQPGNYPLVFHCTAGKDRTGFAAALLLSALDVDWDTVMNDYLLTNHYLKSSLFTSQAPEQAMSALCLIGGVQPSYLNTAKDEIMNRYGSMDNYLRQELNVGNVEKKRLMKYLLK